MVDKRNKNRSLIVSAVVTLVIAIVITSGPASAVIVSISGLSGSITKGTQKTFLVTVTMESPDKFVPISNITLSINGPTTKNWTFNPTSGMLIEPDDTNTIIKVITSPNMGGLESGYGYGYGVDSVGYGYGYNFGYGYGYGYNSGQGGRPISFTYEITLSTTNLTEGDYTATAYLNTGNPAKASFASADSSFTIVPGNIQDKGSISGFKVNDTNGNSVWNPGETGIEDWNIQLVGIGVGTIGINKETTTDDRGFYSFDNLTAGSYVIIETLKDGFVPTSAPVKAVIVAEGGSSMNNNFTNRPI